MPTPLPQPIDRSVSPPLEHPTRRELLLGSAAVVGSLASARAAAPAAPGSRSKWDHEYDFGHSQLFMDQYHEGILEILSKIRGEAELVGELSSRAARVVQANRTVWTSMNDGHMPHWEQRADPARQPRDHEGPGELEAAQGWRHAVHQSLQQAGVGGQGTRRIRGSSHRLVHRQRVSSRGVHRTNHTAIPTA